MITLPEIWNILVMRMPHDEWISLPDIYETVARNHHLDDEDYQPQSPGSDVPKWKRNVRNVLQYRKRVGGIEWDGNGSYRLK